MEQRRDIRFSEEFDAHYRALAPRVREKYDYALSIISTQHVVSQKFVKHLERTDLYELRVSVGTDEHRTLLFAVDAASFIESHMVLLLNSFVKKSTKDYRAAIKRAERLLDEYTKPSEE